MTLYNTVFGVNPIAPILLGILELDYREVPRFRDVFVEGDKIVVYTRMGSGNAVCWCDLSPYCHDKDTEHEGHWCPEPFSEKCLCPACKLQFVTMKHPLYSHYRDDAGDQTYRSLFFTPPERFAPLLEMWKEGSTPDERWTQAIARLEDGGPMPPALTDLLSGLAAKITEMIERRQP